MILVWGESLSISSRQSNPSATPSASGGRPRSCSTTAGSWRRRAAIAAARSAAAITSYSAKDHLSCFCRPGSSSTISSLGLSSATAGMIQAVRGRNRETGHAPPGASGPASGIRSVMRVPLSGDAGDIDTPAERSHVLAHLVRTDPHALVALGRVEGLEQPLADEFGGHAGTGIRDGQRRRWNTQPAGLANGNGHPVRRFGAVERDGHRHGAVLGGGVLGIADHVLDDHRQALRIGLDEHLFGRASDHRHGTARAAASAGAARDLGERDPACRTFDLATLQLLDEPLHALGGVRDGADRVVDELRVAPVPLCVRDDQRQLRREIAQVVHHEGREPVIGLELATLGEPAVGLELRQVHGHVPAHHLEQVAVLVVRFERFRRCGQHDEADQQVDVGQGHDQPVAFRIIGQAPSPPRRPAPVLP